MPLTTSSTKCIVSAINFYHPTLFQQYLHQTNGNCEETGNYFYSEFSTNNIVDFLNVLDICRPQIVRCARQLRKKIKLSSKL